MMPFTKSPQSFKPEGGVSFPGSLACLIGWAAVRVESAVSRSISRSGLIVSMVQRIGSAWPAANADGAWARARHRSTIAHRSEQPRLRGQESAQASAVLLAGAGHTQR